MSLEEKLKQLKTEKETQLAETEKQKQEEGLVPVRDEIKQLNQEVLALERIYNSLPAIIDFTKEQKEAFNEQEKRIYTLFKEYKSVLAELKIETPEDLVEHADFSEDRESVKYKKTHEDFSGAVGSNEKLREMLQKKFDITTSLEDHDALIAALGQKFDTLSDELEKKMLQTPEGREQVVKKLSEKFRKDTDHQNKVEYSVKETSEAITPDHVSFDYFNPVRNNDLELAKKYGDDVIKDAIKELYKGKVEEKERSENKEYDKLLTIGENLAKLNERTEKRSEANSKLNEIRLKKEEVLNRIKQKVESDEDLWSAMASYGAKVDQVLDPFGGISLDYIQEDLRQENIESLDKYLSSLTTLEGKNLKVYDIATTIQYLDEYSGFIDKIEQLINEQGAATFEGKHRGDTEVPFAKISFGDLKRPSALRVKGETIEYVNKKGSIDKAMKAHEKEIEDKKERVQAVQDKIDRLVDINWLVTKQLKRYLDKESEYSDIRALERAAGDLEANRQKAEQSLQELARFAAQHSENSNIIVEVRPDYLKHVEIADELEKLRNTMGTLEQQIKGAESTLEQHKQTKPGMFGQGKWDKKLTELKQELDGKPDTEVEEEKLGVRGMYNKISGEIKKKREKELVAGYKDLIDQFPKEIQEQYQGQQIKLEDLLSTYKENLNTVMNKKLSKKDHELLDEYKKLKNN